MPLLGYALVGAVAWIGGMSTGGEVSRTVRWIVIGGGIYIAARGAGWIK